MWECTNKNVLQYFVHGKEVIGKDVGNYKIGLLIIQIVLTEPRSIIGIILRNSEI